MHHSASFPLLLIQLLPSPSTDPTHTDDLRTVSKTRLHQQRAHIFSSAVNPAIPPSRHPAIPPSRHPAIPPSRHPAIPPSRRPAILPSRHPAIPPSRHPAIPPSRHPAIPPSRHPAIPPSRHPAIPPSRHPAIPPSRHPAIPPSRHPAILPSRHTAIPPSCHPAIFLPRNPDPKHFSKTSLSKLFTYFLTGINDYNISFCIGFTVLFFLCSRINERKRLFIPIFKRWPEHTLDSFLRSLQRLHFPGSLCSKIFFLRKRHSYSHIVFVIIMGTQFIMSHTLFGKSLSLPSRVAILAKTSQVL